MVRFACSLAATALLVACPGSTPAPVPPTVVDEAPARIRIAQLEAKRGDGIGELVDLAAHGPPLERALALRALGRIGGARARGALDKALADDNPAYVTAAAQAYGLLGSLDELSPAAMTAATTALVAALDRVPDAAKPVVIEAIGRVADTSAQPKLVELLTQPKLAPAAALALGRFGRRKIELTPSARLALIDALGSPTTAYGAAYAFARAQISTDTSATTAAAHDRVGPPLAALIDSSDALTRAVAIQAIVKQNVVGSAHAQLEKALLDGDWRVGVEAVRALAGDKGDDAGRDAVAAVVVRRFAELERGKVTEAHVVIEALKVLAPHAKRPLVASAISALARSASASTSVQGITYGWIECLALAAMARGESTDIALVESCKLPDHLRMPIVAELVGAKVGPLAQRRTIFAKLLAHADVRVRAAAIGHLASFWAEGGTADRDAIVSTLVTAIGAPDPIYAGSAIDAAPAIYDAIGTGGSAPLDAAIVARARTEKDPELAASVLELVGKLKIASGLDACRAALQGHPVLATAARHCLLALGEPAPERDEPAGASPPPGIDVRAAFGAPREWVLTTSRGEIVIALDPSLAPWAVATIVALTKRGYYDKLEFHRVVGNFVVQGGDPTQSGWGGPGFTLPAEPSAAGFVAGGVGMADAGRDSAGSQWFIMHSPAPHLDARYTHVGRVKSGSNVADALLIGDAVTTAVIRDSAPAR
jgi:cyclophilin family peptidyl-prolyl cis-trans isomerase